MGSPPSVNVARLTYLLVCEAAGVAIALSTKGTLFEVPLWVGIFGGLGVAALFIWIESLMKGFSLRGFSTATFGLGVGLLCAWLLTRVEISNLLEIAFRDRLESTENSDVLVNALWIGGVIHHLVGVVYAGHDQGMPQFRYECAGDRVVRYADAHCSLVVLEQLGDLAAGLQDEGVGPGQGVLHDAERGCIHRAGIGAQLAEVVADQG